MLRRASSSDTNRTTAMKRPSSVTPEVDPSQPSAPGWSSAFQRSSSAATDRTLASDSFGLAVLIYYLLMEGVHPFAGLWKGSDDPPPIPERIRRGLFAASGDPLIAPSPTSLAFSVLPRQLQQLVRLAFGVGRTDPSARPTPAEWREVIENVEGDLRECNRNPFHVYSGHLRSCPWCKRVEMALPDPFPAPTDLERAPPVGRSSLEPATAATDPPTAMPSSRRPSRAVPTPKTTTVRTTPAH